MALQIASIKQAPYPSKDRGAGSGVWAWRDVCCRMYDALNASNCRSIPTRCRRGQAIGREGNRLLGTCATYALGPSMGAVGRLQGETGSQATATIKLTQRGTTRGGHDLSYLGCYTTVSSFGFRVGQLPWHQAGAGQTLIVGRSASQRCLDFVPGRDTVAHRDF